MPKVNLGWLEDKNGEKFAPKTITTQILTETGKNLDNILKSNEKRLDKKITSPETASVGQLLVVEEIDANGSPVKWRAINAPNNQIQADWEQTDETQVDFVKNKPFYSTIESILYYDSEGDCCAVLEEGKTYSVSINGVLYNDLICTKYYWHQNGGSNCLLLGGTNMDSTDTWNHGFVLYSNLRDSANRIYAISKDTNFNFPIWNSAYSAGKVLTKEDNVDILALNYKTLDDNYIPNTIPRVDTAEVGQIIAVDKVDKNGIPIKWKVVSQNEFVKNTSYATSSTAGLVRALNSYGVSMSDSNLQIYKATSTDIASRTHNYRPIVPSNLDSAVKTSLTNSKITWSDSEKQKARNLIGVKQADWGQYNSNASDYIKNRPFYDDNGLVNDSKEIFNLYIEPYLAGDYGIYDFNPHLSIENGDSYELYINNYLCYSGVWDGMDTFTPPRGAAITASTTITKEQITFYMCNTPINVRIVKTSYFVKDFKQLDEKFIPDNIPKIDSASVGQTIEIEEVDENGKPIKWKAVDKGSSGVNIETDSELLEDSTNPIQNQAVTKEFNTFAGSIEITSNDPVKEKTVLTFNPDAEEINLYTVEEIDNKFSGTVEITDGNPSKENTVITVNPNAEEVNIYTAEEIDNKFSGTVEITGGEPVKENTVLTVNPKAEKINIYTAEEIDVMFGSYATDVASLIGGIE